MNQLKDIHGKKVVVIGGGFAGLGTAILLAKAGARVTLYEKNQFVGGRANLYREQGFTFDMGPSWYLMPEVFEHFFSLIGERVQDHINLVQLSPSYRVFCENEKQPTIDFFSDADKDAATFETIEPGAGQKLKEYIQRSAFQYDVMYRSFIFKNYDSVFDLFTWRAITKDSKLPVFVSMNTYVKRFFKSELLQKIIQHQLFFLGNSPFYSPALYASMSQGDFNNGVLYPQGGMYKVIEALESIAQKNGVHIQTNAPVSEILVDAGVAHGVMLASGEIVDADIVVSNADVVHTELHLLKAEYRTYTETYFDKKVMAPSAFIMYLGIEGKIDSLVHHNLFFANDWQKNFSEIFDTPQWSDIPSLYVGCPSKTDPSVAPEGHESLCVVVPLASGLFDDVESLKRYEQRMIAFIARHMHVPDLEKRIVVKRVYSAKNFIEDYNSYKGSAFGFAPTRMQTAFFRPNNISKKVSNLYYAGAGTNPGIGMALCLASAELVYKRILGIKDEGPLQNL